MKVRMAALVVCLGALTSVGCTSTGAVSSSTTAASTSTTVSGVGTKAQFVLAANSLCLDFKIQAEAIPEVTDVRAYPTAMRGSIDRAKQLQSQLRQLVLPPGDRLALEQQFLDAGDRQIAALEAGLPALDEAVATGDKAAAEAAYQPAAQEFVRIGAASDPFLESYGLTECTTS